MPRCRYSASVYTSARIFSQKFALTTLFFLDCGWRSMLRTDYVLLRSPTPKTHNSTESATIRLVMATVISQRRRLAASTINGVEHSRILSRPERRSTTHLNHGKIDI